MGERIREPRNGHKEGWGLRGKGDGGVEGSPEPPDSESSQQPPSISTFNPAEFPEVRVTPEGQTDKLRNSRG